MGNLREYKLSELYKINSGISTSASQAGHGRAFVSFSTIFNNFYLPDIIEDLMETTEKEQEIYSIKKGDVFLTRTSETIDELAMSCVALNDYPKTTFSGFAKRLRPIQTDKTYDKFMAFFFRSSYFRRIINNHTNMTLRASFNEDIFSYIKFYLPDYKQQIKIGDFLFSIKQKIIVNEKVNSLLLRKIKLIYEQWFVHYEFPNKSGKPFRTSNGEFKYNKRAMRNIPTIFDKVCISDLMILGEEKINPQEHPDELFCHYSIPSYDKYGIYLEEKGIDIKSEKFMVRDGDILVSKLNPRFNRVIIPIKEKNTISSTEFVIWRTNDEKIRNFLFAVAISDGFIRYCISNATGTSNSHKRIDSTLMTDFSIYANSEYISLFGGEISLLVDKFLKNKQENLALEHAIDILLPMFVNGQAEIK